MDERSAFLELYTESLIELNKQQAEELEKNLLYLKELILKTSPATQKTLKLEVTGCFSIFPKTAYRALENPRSSLEVHKFGVGYLPKSYLFQYKAPLKRKRQLLPLREKIPRHSKTKCCKWIKSIIREIK